jgi:hypothetical protein
MTVVYLIQFEECLAILSIYYFLTTASSSFVTSMICQEPPLNYKDCFLTEIDTV